MAGPASPDKENSKMVEKKAFYCAEFCLISEPPRAKGEMDGTALPWCHRDGAEHTLLPPRTSHGAEMHSDDHFKNKHHQKSQTALHYQDQPHQEMGEQQDEHSPSIGTE